MVTLTSIAVYIVIGLVCVTYFVRRNILNPNNPDEQDAIWILIPLWPVYLPIIGCYMIGKKMLKCMKGFGDRHDS